MLPILCLYMGWSSPGDNQSCCRTRQNAITLTGHDNCTNAGLDWKLTTKALLNADLVVEKLESCICSNRPSLRFLHLQIPVIVESRDNLYAWTRRTL